VMGTGAVFERCQTGVNRDEYLTIKDDAYYNGELSNSAENIGSDPNLTVCKGDFEVKACSSSRIPSSTENKSNMEDFVEETEGDDFISFEDDGYHKRMVRKAGETIINPNTNKRGVEKVNIVRVMSKTERSVEEKSESLDKTGEYGLEKVESPKKKNFSVGKCSTGKERVATGKQEKTR